MTAPSPTPGFSSLTALGAHLREHRESQNLTLHSAAHATHIRLSYLDALEQGQPDQLPDLVYVKGFLSRYADYLGLEGRGMSQAWAALAGEKRREPAPRLQTQESRFALRPLHLWGIYVGMVILTVSGLSYVVGGSESPLVRWWQTLQRGFASAPASPPGSPTQPQASSLFETPQDWTAIQGVFPHAQSPAQSNAQPNSQSTPSAVPRSPADPPANQVLVAIQVVERPSWVRVVADNRTVLEDTLQPGTEMSWSANDSIVLRAGNAGGVTVTWNHQPQGVLGNFGEVKEKVYSRAPQP